MEFLTINLGGSEIRVEALEGRPHFVAPMVMIVEGVVNGSRGPLYYPGDEIKHYAPAWNHRPIVVYHPKRNGSPISACTPEVLNTRKIGVVLNNVSDVKPGTELVRWKAEAWIDKSRCRQVDSRVYDALENKQPIEVSTGLATVNEKVDGTFNGVVYNAIARRYMPDHLAILPDTPGACSLNDGAGLLVNDSNREQLAELVRNEIRRLGVVQNTSRPGHWSPVTRTLLHLQRAGRTAHPTKG